MPPDGEMRSRLREKVEETDLALALKTRDGRTPQWAAANVEFADALNALAATEDDRTAFTRYQQAVKAYEEALEIYTDADHYSEWSITTLSLARTLRVHALREGGDRGCLRLERAGKLLADAISNTRDGNSGSPVEQAVFHIELAQVHRAFADTDRSDRRRSHLEETVTAFARAAAIFRNKEKFDNWAAALVGQALAWREIAELAEEKPGAPLFHAAELLKSALTYYTRDQHPFDWMYVHFEYGRTFLQIALGSRDERRRDAASAAVDALRIAAQTPSIHSTPDLWLKLRLELAPALICLAQCPQTEKGPQTENSFSLLEEAVQIYTTAVDHHEKREQAADAALMQGRLGKSLMTLASILDGDESQSCRFKAIEALQKSVPPALKNERQREWMTNFIELGIAFHLTADHDQTERRFSLYEKALDIYRKALSLIDAGDEADLRARLQNQTGLALACLGEHDESDSGLRRLKEAELAFRLALACYEEKNDPFECARMKSNIGNLFYTMARRSGDQEAAVYLRDARHTLMQAMENLDAQRFPAEWSTAQWNYGLVIQHAILRHLSDHAEKDHDEAAAAFRQALSCRSFENDPAGSLNIRRALASLLLVQAQNRAGPARRSCLDEALALYTEAHEWAVQSGREDIAAGTLADMNSVRNLAAAATPKGLLRKLFRLS